MKKKKTVLAGALVLLSVVTSQSAFAASVGYWSFNGWTTNNGSHYIYSGSFTKASTADSTISISGWQDTEVTVAAGLDYNIVEKGWFSETKYGSTYSVEKNVPKSSTWFSNVFSSIPTGKTLYVRIYSDGHSVPVSGAGNAYD